MLSFGDRHATRLCDGWSRREWLRVGGLTSLGLGLPQLLDQRTANASQPPPRAKSCIILFLLGGPPQHETWDPKPDAPAEVRGDLKPISTKLPGVQVGELMPRTAALIERIAVVRSMSTDDNAHSSSGYWMLTGRPHQPRNRENAKPGPPNNWPCLAAAVRYLRGDRHDLPGGIQLPEEIWNTGRIVWPGQDSGWLGDAAEPWLLTCDPSAPDFRVSDLALPESLTLERLEQRRALLRQVNQLPRTVGQTPGEQLAGPLGRWGGLREQAYQLLRSEASRSAFALDRESDVVRDRYGRNRFGQSVLLARRLVEAGVSLVQVNWTRWKDDQAVAPAWDTHAGNSERLKKALMPQMDLAYSALLEDLEQRGLLDETLVVWMGEFGRTPRINARGGRDHWGHVYSVALAGGGIQGGQVYGSSDRTGAFPRDARHEPQDLAATLFHCLGYHPETELPDAFGRPMRLSQGQPIDALLA